MFEAERLPRAGFGRLSIIKWPQLCGDDVHVCKPGESYVCTFWYGESGTVGAIALGLLVNHGAAFDNNEDASVQVYTVTARPWVAQAQGVSDCHSDSLNERRNFLSGRVISQSWQSLGERVGRPHYHKLIAGWTLTLQGTAVNNTSSAYKSSAP